MYKVALYVDYESTYKAALYVDYPLRSVYVQGRRVSKVIKMFAIL